MSYLANNYYSYPITIDYGKGSYLYDDSGKEYIDMFAGFGSVSLGHCHPRIIKTLVSQASQLCVNSRIFKNSNLEELAESLCKLTGLDKFLPMNTGAEAVETAIKAARRWGYQKKSSTVTWAPRIIVAEDCFHGRTTTIVGMSNDPKVKQDFGPYDGGSYQVPFNDVKAIQRKLENEPGIVAVLLEPIQGEGGIIIPSSNYLFNVKQLCEKHNVLLILDEIQSGMGRTGRLFAHWYDLHIIPDILIVGKALGGGVLPISGILATDEVISVFDPGSHGSTFGGNPLAAAVALETLKVYNSEGIVEKSQKGGEYLAQVLQQFNQIPIVKETRCRGLWAGIEVHAPPGLHSPYYFCQKLLEEGVATVNAKHNTIRLSPALNIKPDTLGQALDKIEKVLRAA